MGLFRWIIRFAVLSTAFARRHCFRPLDRCAPRSRRPGARAHAGRSRRPAAGWRSSSARTSSRSSGARGRGTGRRPGISSMPGPRRIWSSGGSRSMPIRPRSSRPAREARRPAWTFPTRPGFEGRVAGDLESRVFLSAFAGSLHGYVQRGDETFRHHTRRGWDRETPEHSVRRLTREEWAAPRRVVALRRRASPPAPSREAMLTTAIADIPVSPSGPRSPSTPITNSSTSSRTRPPSATTSPTSSPRCRRSTGAT